MTTKTEPSAAVIEIPDGEYCGNCHFSDIDYDEQISWCELFDCRISCHNIHRRLRVKCEPCKQKQKVEVRYN